MIRYSLDQNQSREENKNFLARMSILHRDETSGLYKGNDLQSTLMYSNVGTNDYFIIAYLKRLQEK